MIYSHKAGEYSHANYDQSGSQHTSSLANHYDPNFMGSPALRVTSDGVIDADQNFNVHPHRDMEILTYVLEGAVERQDNMGNREQVPADGSQITSAGAKVCHFEYNLNKASHLRPCQIRIIPKGTGTTPRYEQCRFDAAQGKQLVLSSGA